MKYYIVSDIHGFYDQLIFSLSNKGFFDDDKPHKLVILGDILDRGPKAKQMVQFILDEMGKDEVILIKGNHEDLMVEFLDNIEKYADPESIKRSHHYKNCTIDSCFQLIDSNMDDLLNDPVEFANKVKQTSFYKTIIPACLDYFETEKYLFVHGFIPCLYSDNKYLMLDNYKFCSEDVWQSARWINGIKAYNDGNYVDNKIIVAGHIHASYGHKYYENGVDEFGEEAIFTPYITKKYICIDGCTTYSNIVNCIVVDDEECLNIYSKSEGIDLVAEFLQYNQICMIPTDTVFGFCGIMSLESSNKIYELKKRPESKQLPIVVNSIEMIKSICDVDENTETILNKLLPGPITVVLKSKKSIGNSDTFAIRYINDDFINKLINRVNSPLYLTSANISGEEPFENVYDAQKQFKTRIKIYIDGIINYGKSSTIIDLTQNEIKILREGPISLKEIEERLG